MDARKVDVCMIGCWYKDDIYAHSCGNLIEEFKKQEGLNIKIVTSNCNCFSSAQRYSIAREELVSSNCDVVKIPYAPTDPNKKYGLTKYYIVKLLRLNFFFETARGISYFMKARDCEVIHFDQVLRSFGFLSFLTLLNLAKTFGKKVVVTVHELDPLQTRHKGLNRAYNKADKVIVHSEDLKADLTGLGVDKEKIEVIHYGVSLEPLEKAGRDQFIFFGGHKLLKGKGFDTLVEALKIIKKKGRSLKLVVYVGEGCIGLEEGKRRVREIGIDEITWSDFLYGRRLAEEYQKSIGCLIPYTGGSGRYPATSAMANATPVIATRKASLPEYLGDLGIFIKDESAEELAEAVIRLMDNPSEVTALGGKLRERVSERFNWDVVARKTLKVYEEISG